jgi:maleate isomerase
MPSPLPPPRSRIGLIIPSSNRLSEVHFPRYAPADVRINVTRLRMSGASHSDPSALLPKILDAAETLADARCDVIIFHCTAVSMADGLVWNQTINDAIARVTGRSASSTASAMLAALEAINARRLVLVSPYDQRTHDHEIAFLTEAGFEMTQDCATNVGGSDMFIATPPEFWLDSTLKLADSRADAYVLSCTNINSLEVIEDLERRLDRPVITSNQATLWYGLRVTGIQDDVPALGRLFGASLPSVVPA